MEISEIRIFLVRGNSQLKAKANVTLRLDTGSELCIKGFRLHDDGKKAPWIGVPTERFTKNGKDDYADVLWMNQIAQSEIYPKIIDAYTQQINK